MLLVLVLVLVLVGNVYPTRRIFRSSKVAVSFRHNLTNIGKNSLA